MNITLNGETTAVPDTATALTLVGQVTGVELTNQGTAADGSKLGVALALNGQVVPRSAWASTAVSAGDTMDIITAVQGG